MDILDRVESVISQRGLACASTPVLLMVSGGSDSTALAYLAFELSKRKSIGPVAMLHVNHLLRGSSSNADAAFVAQLAQLLDIPLFAAQVDVARLVQEEHGNTEAVARRERYALAVDALKSLCAHVDVYASQGRIFTAHTQNDRVETFYMRSIVGTGPGGFRSMLYRNGCICRPLLDESRQDLRDFIASYRDSGHSVCADEQGSLWREDATNECTDYFRNYVRQEIVPRATAKNPKLFDTLCRTMNLIADEDDYLTQCANKLYEEHVAWLVSASGAVPEGSVFGNESEGAAFGNEPECAAFGNKPEYDEGCVLSPLLGQQAAALQRRVVVRVLQEMLGPDARVETASVEAVCQAYSQGKPAGGYVANIQGNLAVSANRQGVRIEPMSVFRTRRKRG